MGKLGENWGLKKERGSGGVQLTSKKEMRGEHA